MLHLILLVLCWIFGSVVLSIEAAKDDEGAWRGDEFRYNFVGRVFKIMWASMLMGTALWAILEGIYYFAAPHFS